MDQIITIGSGTAAGETQAGATAETRSAAPGGDAHGGEGLDVTASAVKRIRAILAKESISTETGGLRLGVKGGGCSGMSYSVGFDKQPRERDNIFEFDGVRVFVDPKSFVYLKGMKLDYEETLIRQGFNFINPNSTRSCGCGSSFSV